MKWASSLNLFKKKRNNEDCSNDDHTPASVTGTEQQKGSASIHTPKRRSLQEDRRSSFEKWQEARRVRNSLEDQSNSTRTTDKLTVCKAGDTTILNNSYILIKHLGSGTFGKVKLCFNICDKKLYAVKVCRKSQLMQGMSRTADRRLRRNSSNGPLVPVSPAGAVRMQEAMACFQTMDMQQPAPVLPHTEHVVKEIAILKKLKHPNIVSLVEVIDDPRTDNLLLVMEYVEGGTLECKQTGPKSWEQMPESDVWRCTREVLQGLDYLHYHKVVHGDLKPANLLWDSTGRKVKIGDFSSSMALTEGASTGLFSTLGSWSTPAFRAPESLRSGYFPSYEMDMWALGVCIYMWVYGQLPFHATNPAGVYEKIRTQDVHLPPYPAISPQLRDFILRLLDKSCPTRLDVLSAVQHPWITMGGDMPLQSLHATAAQGSEIRVAPLDVTPEDLRGAIRTSCMAAHLLDNIFYEHKYYDRQNLVTLGEPASKILLIFHGEVEIYKPCMCIGDEEEPIISCGVLEELLDTVDPELLDMSSSSSGEDELIGVDAEQMLAFRRSSTQGSRILAVRGPGESLGLACLQHDGHKHAWKASVRARGEVIAFVARVEDMLKLMEKHPEIEPAVQQIVVQQETDMLVAEAMRQLCLTSSRLATATALAQRSPQPVPIALS